METCKREDGGLEGRESSESLWGWLIFSSAGLFEGTEDLSAFSSEIFSLAKFTSHSLP